MTKECQRPLPELLGERARLLGVRDQIRPHEFQLDIEAAVIAAAQKRISGLLALLEVRIGEVEGEIGEAAISVAEDHLLQVELYEQLQESIEREVRAGRMAPEKQEQIQAACAEFRKRPDSDPVLRLGLAAYEERQRKANEPAGFEGAPRREKEKKGHSVIFNPVSGEVWVDRTKAEKNASEGAEAIVLWQLAQKGEMSREDIEEALRLAGLKSRAAEVILRLRKKIEPNPENPAIITFSKNRGEKGVYRLEAKDFIFRYSLPDGQVMDIKHRGGAWCFHILSEAYQKRQKVSVDCLAERICGEANRITRRRISADLVLIRKKLPSGWEVKTADKSCWLEKEGEGEPVDRRSAEETAVLTAVTSCLLVPVRPDWEDLQRKLRPQILTDPQRRRPSAIGGMEYRAYNSGKLLELSLSALKKMSAEAENETLSAQWTPEDIQLWEQIKKQIPKGGMVKFINKVKRKIPAAAKGFFKGGPEIEWIK